MRTIGIAVPVPTPHCTHLQEARLRFGDPMATKIPAHVTLLPPTEVSEEEHEALMEHLRGVAARFAPFEMLLRGTGTFRPVSPVVFVQVARGIPQCERLEAAVRSGPVRRDLDFPYHPHVTVAHHLSDDQLDLAFEELARYEVSYTVKGFDLYHHGEDGIWRSVHTFALEGGAPTRED